MLEVGSLRTEYLENPLGLDATLPRLGWKLYSSGTNVMQTAYHIQASGTKDFNDLLWDTGKIESDQSQAILYAGPSLKTLQRVYWRVKVWGNHDEVSLFSEYAFFEMGLLHTSDWHAFWIDRKRKCKLMYINLPLIFARNSL